MAQIRLIGTDPSQVPTNGMLGNLAFQNAESVSLEKLVVSGDVQLNDGGTYTTTVQTITPTANRTISFPDATGTIALVAGSSGQLQYNNAGVSAGASTLSIDASGNVAVDTNTLYVDVVNNRVAIGTTSPSTRLQVQDSIAGGSGGTIATLHNISETGGDTRYAGLLFQVGATANNGLAAIRAAKTASAVDHQTELSFWTQPTAGLGNDPFRAMTISSTQKVGIGTASPYKELHVYKSSGTTTLWIENGGTQKGIAAIGIDDNSYTFQSTYNTGGTAARPFVWYNVSTELMRLDSSGRFLAGTSTARSTFLAASYSSLLQVERAGDSTRRICASYTYGNSDAGAPFIVLAKHRGGIGDATVVQSGDALGFISFEGADGTQFVPGAFISAAVDGTPGNNDMPGRLVFSTTADGASSPTERMRISQNGAITVGGGTSSSAHRLAIVQTTNTNNTTPTVYIERNEGGAGGSSVMTVGLEVNMPTAINNSSVTGIKVFASAAAVENTGYAIHAECQKQNNGVARAARFVGGHGNIGGYGTQNVVDIIAQVAGDGNHGSVRGLYIENPNYDHTGGSGRNIGITLNDLTTAAVTHSAIVFERNSSAVGSITNSTTATSYLTSSSSGLLGVDATTIAFQTNSSERARIDSSGRLLVGTSTATANGGKLELSGGITFPATAVAASNPKTLDDYEEGTWVPSVGGNATYSYQLGEYVKIGRVVHVICTLIITTLGTGSTMDVTGLPFLITAGYNYGGSYASFSGIATNVVSLYCNAIGSGNRLTVHVATSLTAAADSVASANIFKNGTRVDFTVTYTT